MLKFYELFILQASAGPFSEFCNNGCKPHLLDDGRAAYFSQTVCVMNNHSASYANFERLAFEFDH